MDVSAAAEDGDELIIISAPAVDQQPEAARGADAGAALGIPIMAESRSDRLVDAPEPVNPADSVELANHPAESAEPKDFNSLEDLHQPMSWTQRIVLIVAGLGLVVLVIFLINFYL